MSEETTIFRGSPSILTRFGSLFLGCLLMAGGAVLFFTVGNLQPAVKWVSAGLAGVALLFVLGTIVVVKSTQYEVTSERIRVRRGILTKRTDELELYRVTDTSLIEPLSLRIVGLGTIELRTSDASTPVLHLKAIRGTRAVRENLRKYIEECRERKRVRVTEFDQPDADPGPGPGGNA
jgi:uncharacterized membrane protein YdbT with pleckstrin-like domain